MRETESETKRETEEELEKSFQWSLCFQLLKGDPVYGEVFAIFKLFVLST